VSLVVQKGSGTFSIGCSQHSGAASVWLSTSLLQPHFLHSYVSVMALSSMKYL
jgi:hypothetical protein